MFWGIMWQNNNSVQVLFSLTLTVVAICDLMTVPHVCYVRKWNGKECRHNQLYSKWSI